MFYTYIIKGCGNRVYIGLTHRKLSSKLSDHRRGSNGAFKIKTPFSLIFVSKSDSLDEGKRKKSFIKAMYRAGLLRVCDE